MPKTTTVEHVGELKVSLSAETLEDIFVEVARLIAREAGSARGVPNEWQRITVSARDRTTLLADWANELLGKSEADGRAYSEIRNVRLTDRPDRGTIAADVRGPAVKRWSSPLKAATYHNLSLQHDGTEWRAVVLFDV